MKYPPFVLLPCVAFGIFCACASLNGSTSNKYVVSPLTDTLTVKLPDYENEFCEVVVYGNNAYFRGTDYVLGGCVKFGVGSLPAGRHRVGIRVGDLVADEYFVKR